ncbi:hypothetical protein EV356DRAFT_507517 [Viridothelium virens]|uniref:Nudix hydrolase domain-containing protein n=1 Tax=Viridothelium virens TaxID=1048519 RepID=A0A6A6HKJ8_VIRVR|nr:hypothetical protein EV356DRAFT_507517 [Viridothelium virens]
MDQSKAQLQIPPSLVEYLRDVLHELSEKPYPEIPNPPNLNKRASVAVILRIKPNYTHWPSPDAPLPHKSANDSNRERIQAFFGQEWVKHGDPELLFMKRAARKGDRWTSHVALPGGRRDPEDADDKAAAIREASEEVGITLDKGSCLEVGNLPQRLVTTSWGKVPLMVLCPYIFLITKHDIPPLRLQPTETGSAHWVPLRALLGPGQRTFELQDVSSRLAHQEVGIKKWFLRAMLGRMVFAAIRLVPSESTYCTSIEEFYPLEVDSRESRAPGIPSPIPWIPRLIPRREQTYPPTKPLLLWGLTLGVLADFLELLPPHNALRLWTYPTFTPWDVRFVVWALSYRFRKQKERELLAQSTPDMMWGDEQNEVEREVFSRAENGFKINPHRKDIPLADQYKTTEEEAAEVGISGIPSGQNHASPVQRRNSGAVSLMLEGYYDIVRRAVAVALAGRCVGATALLFFLWHRRRSLTRS